MALFLKCPTCRAQLRIPDRIVASGQNIRCPRCKTPVTPTDAIEYNPSPPSTKRPPQEPHPRAPETKEAIKAAPSEPPRTTRPTRETKSVSTTEGRSARRDRSEPHTPPPKNKDKQTIIVPLPPPEPHRPSSPADLVDDLPVEIIEEKPKAPPGDDEKTTLNQRAYRPRQFDDDDDAEARKPLRVEELEKPRTGVNLVYISACIMIAACGAFYLGLLVFWILRATGAVTAGLIFLTVMTVVAGLSVFAGSIVAVIGQVFCCFSPARAGAQVLAIVSIVFSASSVLLYVVSFFLSLISAGILGLPFQVIGAFLALTHSFLFLFYLRALAQAIRVKLLADSIRNLIIAYAAAAVFYPLICFIVVIALGVSASSLASLRGSALTPQAIIAGAGVTVLVLGFIGMGVSLALFIWFMRSIVDLLDALDSKMGQRYGGGGTPVWITLLAGTAVVFALNVLFALAMHLLGGAMTPTKEKTFVPVTPGDERPLFHSPAPMRQLRN